MPVFYNPNFGRASISVGNVRFSPPPGGDEVRLMPAIDLGDPWVSQLRPSFPELFERVHGHQGSLSADAENLERLVGWAACGQHTVAVTASGLEPAGLRFDGDTAAEAAYGWAWNAAWLGAQALRERLLGPALPKDLAERLAALRESQALVDWKDRGSRQGLPKPPSTLEELASGFPPELADVAAGDPSARKWNLAAVKELSAAVDEVVRTTHDPAQRYAALVAQQKQHKQSWALKLSCGYAVTEDGLGDSLSVSVDLFSGFVVESSGPGLLSDDLVFAQWGAVESAQFKFSSALEQFRHRSFDKHREQFSQASRHGLDDAARPEQLTVAEWLQEHPDQAWAQQKLAHYEETKTSGRLFLSR